MRTGAEIKTKVGRVSSGSRGKRLEDLVEEVFKDASLKGLPVWVLRQNNKWVPGRGGKAVPVRGKGSPVDFVGVVAGVPVALECKEYRAGGRLSLNAARFPAKEVSALRGFEAAGGRAFVVAAFWGKDTVAIYPFPLIYEAWKAYRAGRGEAGLPFSRNGVLVGSVKDISSLPAACVSLVKGEEEGGEVAPPHGFVCAGQGQGLFG